MIETLFYGFIGLFVIVVGIALSIFFFSAIGSAIESTSDIDHEYKKSSDGVGGAGWGALFGLVAGIAFFVYWFSLL